MNIELMLDEDLLEAIDRIAEETGRSRDELITAAMNDSLKRRRNQQIAERINEVYRDPLSPAEEEREREWRKTIKAYYRRHLLDEW